MGEFGMVIVGAGQAGGRAALTLRDQGHDGRIVLLAAEPSPPYERPPLSKAYLTGERAADDFTFAKAAALEAAGIEFRPACVVEAIERRSRTVRLRGGERVCYAKLLLATGRAPRRLPLEGAVAERVLYLRDLSDADRLRQALRPGARIAIVGGGFIGLEVAASASALGCRPLVIELLPRLLSRMVPAPIAAFLRRRAVVLVGPVRADGERALGVGVLPAFQPHQPRRHGVREGADVARGEHGGSAVASVASTTMPLSTARPAASASPVRGTRRCRPGWLSRCSRAALCRCLVRGPSSVQERPQPTHCRWPRDRERMGMAGLRKHEMPAEQLEHLIRDGGRQGGEAADQASSRARFGVERREEAR